MITTYSCTGLKTITKIDRINSEINSRVALLIIFKQNTLYTLTLCVDNLFQINILFGFSIQNYRVGIWFAYHMIMHRDVSKTYVFNMKTVLDTGQ